MLVRNIDLDSRGRQLVNGSRGVIIGFVDAKVRRELVPDLVLASSAARRWLMGFSIRLDIF